MKKFVECSDIEYRSKEGGQHSRGWVLSNDLERVELLQFTITLRGD